MAKAKKQAKEEVAPKVYKGYNVKWLKQEGEQHPDYKLVAEYEAKYGEIK